MNINLIQSIASNLGFSHLGITKPSKAEHFEIYRSWIAQNLHAEMSYLAREDALEKRQDILKVFPECLSILTLAFPYSSPKTPSPNQTGLLGEISSYAYGIDYHILIQERITQLVKELQIRFHTTFSWKAYVDTGPLLERELAVKSGLGWIGKNSSVIHPKFGSFFFLSELLIDLELPPTHIELPDRCGKCKRCIEACPTQAILPNRTINANRCLSYVTIENKGPIPKEIRPLMGNRIFGCDACQVVCPWNQDVSIEIEPTFLPEIEERSFPYLLQEIQLTPQEFNEKFKNTPIKRAKRRGYLRNVAVALGNSKSSLAIPSLRRILKDEDESLIRQHAAWALGEIHDQTAKSALLSSLSVEEDPLVRSEIFGALENHA